MTADQFQIFRNAGLLIDDPILGVFVSPEAVQIYVSWIRQRDHARSAARWVPMPC